MKIEIFLLVFWKKMAILNNLLAILKVEGCLPRNFEL